MVYAADDLKRPLAMLGSDGVLQLLSDDSFHPRAVAGRATALATRGTSAAGEVGACFWAPSVGQSARPVHALGCKTKAEARF
jgi:hypothetical protein